MKEYLLPQKYVKKIFYIDSILVWFVIAVGITLIVLEGDGAAVLMLLSGVLMLVIGPVRANNIIYKVIVTEEAVDFITKKHSNKICYKDITRLSFRKKLFDTKSIIGFHVFGKESSGYVDIRTVNSGELIEDILVHCPHLSTGDLMKELKRS